jgi:phage terminase large subunit-like protein
MSRDQAALVYRLASKMMQSPELTGLFKDIPSSKLLLGLKANTEYKAISAEGKTAHGLSPKVAILDEVGQVKGPSSPFIEAIVTAQGAYDDALLIAISTQAANDADMFSQWCDDAERSKDPRTVCHLYTTPVNADMMDESKWKFSNPALGVFRSSVDMKKQMEKASRLPSTEASTRNLLLNQRIALDGNWLAPTPWKACSGLPDLDVFRTATKIAMGLDLSARQDLTAAVLAAADEEGDVHLLPFVFCPSAGIEERGLRDRAPYAQWVKSGDLVALGGASMDYAQIFVYLAARLKEFGIEVNEVHFDRWRWEIAKAEADNAGFCPEAKWIPVGQGFKDMSPRCEAFEQLLLTGKIRHGAHPLFNMAASNAVAVRDPTGAKKLDKTKATQRIDPLVAAVMAAYPVSEGLITPAFAVEALIG